MFSARPRCHCPRRPDRPARALTPLALRAWFGLAIVLAALPAPGAERHGDARAAAELQHSADAAGELQRRFLAAIEAAPQRDRFDLYRVYDESVGTWLQVGVLRELLEDAMSADAPDQERRSRAELRDCARYALAEIDRSLVALRAAIDGKSTPGAVEFEKKSRPLLKRARPVIARLAAGP
jgi:hypothetical protein